MYIQEVIIDGFKSYAQRTVVTGFDPQFNAITGLNGTGKSNILDAICFVLGISNLSQVRVGNLQELVYKQGQAGVTKASVTVIFNNADPATSPVGYETHKQITVTRQVVIGGKNKYMVNGHTVQQNQVQNLFHSVQLNVNNPHFLIMQGRITKVLNMKPPEILSMIEEAAGTRMFENKKQASLKTIEKKQAKVDEITKSIDEEITPTLENLRHERQDYHAWQANQSEYERVDKLCIAADFVKAQETVRSSDSDKAKMVQTLEQLQELQEQRNDLVEECNQQIALIVKARDEAMDGEVKVLKKREADLSKDVVKANTVFTNQSESIASERDALEQLVKQMDAIDISIDKKGRELEAVSATMRNQEEEVASADADYTKMREKYQNACAGVADQNTADLLSIPEQIVAWEKCVRETSSKIAQTEQKAAHVKNQQNEQQRAKTSQGNSHKALAKEADDLRAAIDAAQKQLSALSVAGEAVTFDQLQAARQEVEQMRTQVNSLQAAVAARLAFDYKEPERGFDRSRVKGPVAKLFQMTDQRFGVALEVVAGGKLTQIVVDNETTGKLILQKGALKKRVTMLPLNKLSSRVIPEDKVRAAKAVASRLRGSAHLALELVRFDESVRSAMEYTFGNVIICDSPEIAKAITFDKGLRLKTVTMQGDSYDPAGTLTGGSATQMGSLLQRLHEFQTRQASLQQKQGALQGLEGRYATAQSNGNRIRDIQSDLDLKVHALGLVEDKLSNTDYSQMMKRIEESASEAARLAQELADLRALSTKAQTELNALSSSKASITNARERKLKEFEDSMKAAQKAVSALKAKLATVKAQRDTLLAEIKGLKEEKETLVEQRAAGLEGLEKLIKEAKAQEAKLSALRGEYETVREAYAARTAELNQKSKEIQAIEKNKEVYAKEAQTASLEARKVTHQLKQWEKDSKDAHRMLAGLIKQHPWIEREKEYFGQAGTDFDFASKDMTAAYKRLKELKTEQERLSKKINKKVVGMIETAEAEYEDLTRKRQVILNDKAKIESVIQELDVQKVAALQKTYTQVNKDFGSIFSMLLPGTSAKLEPLDGDIELLMEGLEVKVAFNSVWKDSLTELSGGQRSLLALSLILALLLFKPAPMYILDEVDAALDLSHTQNIGMMIRTHFSASQFIVVSLKEGMFNNANVIFRTRFVDGVSAVTRTVSGMRAGAAGGAAAGRKAIEQENVEDEEEDDSAPMKKKGKKAAGRKKGETAVEAF